MMKNAPGGLDSLTYKIDQVSMLEGAIFMDQRAHVLFTDKTAIIIHTGGNCFTYFNSKGERTRQTIRFATRANSILEKLKLSIQFYNKFGHIPILESNTYTSTTIQKSSKSERAYWRVPPPMEDLNMEEREEELVHKDPKGNIVVESISGNARLKLSENGYLILTEFDCLFPNKKPVWVDVGNNENKGYKNTKEVKLSYPYAVITQIQTISNIGREWEIPMEIAWEEYKRSEGESIINPINPINPISPRVNNPGYRVCENEWGIDLPSPSLRGTNNEFSGGVWDNDQLSPIFNILAYPQSDLYLLWNTNATYRVINPNNIHVHIHLDDSILVKDRDLFTHFKSNSLAAEAHRMFTADTIPPYILINNAPYELIDIITTLSAISKVPIVGNTQIDHESISRSNIADLWGSTETHRELCVEGLGIFTAFKDKSVKGVFEDRTIIRLHFGHENAMILSNKGERLNVLIGEAYEFDSYIKTCIEFMQYVFMPEKEKETISRMSIERESTISNELHKIHRTLLRVSDKTEELNHMELLPDSQMQIPDPNVFEESFNLREGDHQESMSGSLEGADLGSSQPPLFDIQKILAANQLQIKKIQDTLARK